PSLRKRRLLHAESLRGFRPQLLAQGRRLLTDLVHLLPDGVKARPRVAAHVSRKRHQLLGVAPDGRIPVGRDTEIRGAFRQPEKCLKTPKDRRQYADRPDDPMSGRDTVIEIAENGGP